MPSVELSLAERSYVIDIEPGLLARAGERLLPYWQGRPLAVVTDENVAAAQLPAFLKSLETAGRSEEHTSELQSLMRSSYAVFCLTKKKYICKHLEKQHKIGTNKP